ncbi:MAG: hypothetical protein ICV63_16710 [Coleofasciculus sp. Co-bin14]|nr:hypothetical protein [Coleofasciculus sp. Co-bin14]
MLTLLTSLTLRYRKRFTRFAISLEECAQRNRATRQVQPHSRLIREL